MRLILLAAALATTVTGCPKPRGEIDDTEAIRARIRAVAPDCKPEGDTDHCTGPDVEVFVKRHDTKLVSIAYQVTAPSIAAVAAKVLPGIPELDGSDSFRDKVRDQLAQGETLETIGGVQSGIVQLKAGLYQLLLEFAWKYK